MNAYLNLSDFSHALHICKSYKRNPEGFYSIDDYILSKQYASDFMKGIWQIVKDCKVSLKVAFDLIRYNTMAITDKVMSSLKEMIKPTTKALTPKAISQLLRAERQQAKQNDLNDMTMRVKVKRYWNRQEHRFHRQTVCVPLPLTESEIKALKPW